MSDTQQQGIPAVGFLVMAFLDETSADQMLDAMKQAKQRGQFYFEDAAVIQQDAQGKVHYHETGEMGRERARASARWSAASWASWAARSALRWAQGLGPPSARLLPVTRGSGTRVWGRSAWR